MPDTEKKKNSVTEKLDDTLKDFKSLTISEQPKHIGEPSSSSQSTSLRKRSQSCTIFTISDTVSNSPLTNSSRFRPYALPKVNRIATNNAGNATTLKPRPKILINDGDPVEDKEADLSDDELVNRSGFKKFKSCSQEAASTAEQLDEDTSELNFEIDELAEYFEHFVSIQIKMSTLAESMYA